jgi:hypothetical protein
MDHGRDGLRPKAQDWVEEELRQAITGEEEARRRTEHSAGRPCRTEPAGAAGSDRETNPAMGILVRLTVRRRPCAPLRGARRMFNAFPS